MRPSTRHSDASRSTSVETSSTKKAFSTESPTDTFIEECKYDDKNDAKRSYARTDAEKAERISTSVIDADMSAPDGVEENVRKVDSRPGARKEDYDGDGGLAGWLTVLGAWMIQFTGFGYSNAYGVYQDFYVREYLTSFTSSQISWIGSTQVFILMAAGVITGRLFDRGYFYHLVVTGSIILIFSLFMLSLAKPEQYYQIFLTQGLLNGLGSGLTYVPSVAVISQHFHNPATRALAMGLVASGSSLGGILHPIMLNNLFHKGDTMDGAGFAGGVRASAGLVAGMQVVAGLLMRARYDRAGPGRVVSEKSQEGEQKTPGLWESVKKFSRDMAYIALVSGMALFSQGLFFPIFYLQLDAIEHGLSPSFAFYSLTILNACSLIGRIIPGFFARQLGVTNMIIASGAICSILVFSMLGVKDVPGVAAFAALYGFFSGAYVTLLAPMLALLADHPSEMGARMGVCFLFVGLGSLVGTPINGALLTTRFIWWRPIVFSGIVSLAGTFLISISKIVVMRRKARATQQGQ